MKLFNIILYLWLSILSAISCTSNENESNLGDLSNLELALVALDENGTERTVFEEGTNITLSVKVINHSNKEIELDGLAGSGLCQFFNYDDFLLIYEIVGSDVSVESQLVAIGKAYNPPVACPDINLPIRIQPDSEQYLVSGSWNDNPSNPPLTKGSYYSVFNHELTLINGISKTYKMEEEFEIE